MQLWGKLQGALVAGWQGAAEDWFRHRLQGIAALTDTAQGLCECKNLDEVASLHRAWVAGALERLSADACSLANGTVSSSGVCLSVLIGDRAAFAGPSSDTAPPPSASGKPAESPVESRSPADRSAKAVA